MQRHKMHHSFGQPGGQQDCQAEARAEGRSDRPEEGNPEDEEMLFGRKAETPGENGDARGAESPADEQALPQESAEERCKAELNEMRLRAAAEMDNFKKRLAREHEMASASSSSYLGRCAIKTASART